MIAVVAGLVLSSLGQVQPADPLASIPDDFMVKPPVGRFEVGAFVRALPKPTGTTIHVKLNDSRHVLVQTGELPLKTVMRSLAFATGSAWTKDEAGFSLTETAETMVFSRHYSTLVRRNMVRMIDDMAAVGSMSSQAVQSQGKRIESGKLSQAELVKLGPRAEYLENAARYPNYMTMYRFIALNRALLLERIKQFEPLVVARGLDLKGIPTGRLVVDALGSKVQASNFEPKQFVGCINMSFPLWKRGVIPLKFWFAYKDPDGIIVEDWKYLELPIVDDLETERISTWEPFDPAFLATPVRTSDIPSEFAVPSRAIQADDLWAAVNTISPTQYISAVTYSNEAELGAIVLPITIGELLTQWQKFFRGDLKKIGGVLTYRMEELDRGHTDHVSSRVFDSLLSDLGSSSRSPQSVFRTFLGMSFWKELTGTFSDTRTPLRILDNLAPWAARRMNTWPDATLRKFDEGVLVYEHEMSEAMRADVLEMAIAAKGTYGSWIKEELFEKPELPLAIMCRFQKNRMNGGIRPHESTSDYWEAEISMGWTAERSSSINWSYFVKPRS